MAETSFNPEERSALLALARKSIAKKLKLDYPDPKVPVSLKTVSHNGAFVSLRKRGRLRGCIGRFSAEGSVTEIVEEMAQAAAFEDPRFPSLSATELKETDLEISVLTPLRRIDDLEEIQVGRHGIYIISGVNRGVLLPQVAVEQGWDRQTFLENTCLKAGLGANCWQDDRTEIHIFRAEVFGEKDREND